MYAHICSQGDASNKKQKSIDRIEGQHGDGNSKALHDGGANQVDERQHSEYRNEHDVVDDRWVAREGIMDNVAYQRQDEEGHQEL